MAIDGDKLVVRRADPPNAETRLDLQEGLITPNPNFYVRCNFPVPSAPPGLELTGLFEQPAPGIDLERFTPRRLVVTLECAGNGRVFLDPPAPGEQWELGAVGTAEWSGVALADVLREAGPGASARELIFTGADGFARSLPIDRAAHPDTLLVTAMNGEPLPPEHGGPLRLLVPGWYGMASVKWLVQIAASAEPFQGHFQVEKYVIGERPVREMEVRSVIVGGDGSGVRGFAWSGRGEITGVDVSADGGQAWRPASLGEPASEYSWTPWQIDLALGSGRHTLLSRAADAAGRVQPLEQSWNELGYANNQAQPFHLTIA